jgi:hypothetical protein
MSRADSHNFFHVDKVFAPCRWRIRAVAGLGMSEVWRLLLARNSRAMSAA